MKSLALLLVALTSSAAPLSPQQELATFHFADPDLRVELVAAEPDVISPVAIAFDASGRMFVAEMMDYPLGSGGGQIRCLEDRDSDGRFERATVFATKLPYPNGVLPWNGGVLVTAAPDILFLKDTDGDDRADERRVMLTGFGKGNQQLRVNGLIWGLDNYVYGANGRSDGEVQKMSLRGHDFRFRPDTGEFETLAGRSQFGLAFDDWGNRFLSWNTIAVRHEVIPQRYLLRHPGLSGNEGVFDLAENGDSGEVFPLTPAPLTFNKESISHFNALAGLAVFRGTALGRDYYGNAFMGESLRNLIHRRILVPDGATFVARRGDQGKEFLASTDPWFHPVNFCTGPDGALYVVDFYRHFVEHPDYVPEKLRNTQAWRTGAEHGRIWRVVKKGYRFQRAPTNFERASTEELVAALEDANGWRRDTAHRILLQKGPREAIPLLRRAVTNSSVRALHALWILEAFDAVDVAQVLNHADPGVREHAVRIAERRLPSGLLDFEPKGNSRLALQLILSLGQVSDESALDRLSELGLGYGDSRWHSLALLSSVARQPLPFLRRLAKTEFFLSPNQAHKEFLQRLGALLATEGSKAVDFVAALPEASSVARLALVPGMGKALKGRALQGLAVDAERIALDPNAPLTDRVIAISALRHLSPHDCAQAFMRVLDGASLREAVAAEVVAVPDALAEAFANWPRWSLRTRKLLLGKAARSNPAAVVDALEKQRVSPVEIDAVTRETLRKSRELQERLERLFVVANRDEVVRRMEPALSLIGDAQKGAASFAAKCLMCHALRGQGTGLGPDLSGMNSRPKSALLRDILDPSRQVTPDFAAYAAVLSDGETISGLVVADNEASITLRRPNMSDTVVARNQIRELRADGKSLMPDGLEEGLTVADVADLLAFLVQTDKTRLAPGP